MRAVSVISVAILLLLIVSAVSVQGTFLLDSWIGPSLDDGLAPTNPPVSTATYNGAVHLVYETSNGIYWTSSPNGQQFPGGVYTQLTTALDPELVVVPDSVTGASTLLLLYVPVNSNTIWYSVFSGSSSRPFPGGAATNVTNCGGALDAAYLPSTRQLVVIFAASPATPTMSGLGSVVTATYTSGQLYTGGTYPINDGEGAESAWRSSVETAVFISGGNTVVVVQYGSPHNIGQAYYWFSTAPAQPYAWKSPYTQSGYVPTNNYNYGFTGTTFQLAPGCTDVGVVFSVNSTVTGFVYNFVSPSSGAAYPTASIPLNVPFSPAYPTMPSVTSFNQSIFLYYVDTGATPHDVIVYYTTPTL